MQWLVLIYKHIGAGYPWISLVIMFLLGGLMFSGAWYLVGRAYQDQINKEISVVNSSTERRIPSISRDSIVKILSRDPANAYVGALAPDPEAFGLATDIWVVLKDAGWNLPGGRIAELIGRMDPGITIKLNGDQAKQSAVVFRDTMNKIKLDAEIITDNEIAPDAVVIYVGPRPTI